MLQQFSEDRGLPEVRSCNPALHHLQIYPKHLVKLQLQISMHCLSKTICLLLQVGTVSADDIMDDGTPIKLAVTVNRRDGSAVFDFKGAEPLPQVSALDCAGLENTDESGICHTQQKQG